MFAVEIDFNDGVSQPEMILVRRPQALIGASEMAHVVIDDMSNLDYQLKLVRDFGERFEVIAIKGSPSTEIPQGIEGVHEGCSTLNLGRVQLVVTPLSSDLLVKDGEPPDRAGIRLLRRACLEPAPHFPAALVAGDNPIVVSFAPDQSVMIGRSKECIVRLESADISSRHAKLGYEDGEFWVEDLGSTNGTFVNGQQVSGRTSVMAGVPIVLGGELTLFGVTSEDQILGVVQSQPTELPPSVTARERYPIVLSVSSIPRPARLVLPVGTTVRIGRDPQSEIWLGAPHVSRTHCTMALNDLGEIVVTDCSTNGTGHDTGVLKRGEILSVFKSAKVFDFGGGITLAVCFNEDHEKAFVASAGSLSTFAGGTPIGDTSSTKRAVGESPFLGSSVGELYSPDLREREMYQPELTALERVGMFYLGLPTAGKVMLFLCLVALLAVFGIVILLALGLLR